MEVFRRSSSGQTFAQMDALKLMVNYGRKSSGLTVDFKDKVELHRMVTTVLHSN